MVNNTLRKYAAESEWVILTNWMMALQHGQPIEVDMIVIGPYSVVVIEVKHWKWSRIDDAGNISQLISDVNLLQSK
ncbi:MAG: nuclease-related domain-containing protein, partial [Chloroflexi bacterium]|nr:nuclease-related domain-containing protein [Chloroflexota bacterium]